MLRPSYKDYSPEINVSFSFLLGHSVKVNNEIVVVAQLVDCHVNCITLYVI